MLDNDIWKYAKHWNFCSLSQLKRSKKDVKSKLREVIWQKYIFDVFLTSEFPIVLRFSNFVISFSKFILYFAIYVFMYLGFFRQNI